MTLASAVPALRDASPRCMARAERLVKVKFVGLAIPARESPTAAPETRSSPLSLLTRVFGRLWAARP